MKTQRDYVEFLVSKADPEGKSKADPEGKFPGAFSVRRDKKDGSDGLAVIQDTDKGYWEVGLFKTGRSLTPNDKPQPIALLNTIRRKESICQ